MTALRKRVGYVRWHGFMDELRRLDGPTDDRDRGIETSAGEERYVRHRLDGMTPRAAYRAAVAWETNTIEQKIRRTTHDTGCPPAVVWW